LPERSQENDSMEMEEDEIDSDVEVGFGDKAPMTVKEAEDA